MIEPVERTGIKPSVLGYGVVLLLIASCVYSQSALAHEMIGVQECKKCHEFAYLKWKRGPHAEAHTSLTEAQRSDTKCNNCHTTLPGDTSAKFEGIQCERCHGGGQYYYPAHVMKDKELSRAVGLVDITEAHCKQCHTETTPSIEPFDFESAWARIGHGKSARELWESAQSASKDVNK